MPTALSLRGNPKTIRCGKKQAENKLLDLLKFNLEDLRQEGRMHDIASFIFSNFLIQGIHGESFHITALEFYLYHKTLFQDSASHRQPLQLSSGKFYVHTHGKESNFKSPNYSGIDITCGNSEHAIWGGILLRQLDFMAGPGKAAQLLVKGKKHTFSKEAKWTDKEKAVLRSIQWTDIFDSPIKLIARESPVKVTLKTKKRVGIKLSSMEDALFHFKAIYPPLSS